MSTLRSHVDHSLAMLGALRLPMEDRLARKFESVGRIKLNGDYPKLVQNGINEIISVLLRDFNHRPALSSSAVATMNQHILEPVIAILREKHFERPWSECIGDAKLLVTLIEHEQRRADPLDTTPFDNTSLFIQRVCPNSSEAQDTIPYASLAHENYLPPRGEELKLVNTTLNPVDFGGKVNDVVFLVEPIGVLINGAEVALKGRMATNIPRSIDMQGVYWDFSLTKESRYDVTEFALNILNRFVPPGTDGYPPQCGRTLPEPFDSINTCSFTALALCGRFAPCFLSTKSPEGGLIDGDAIEIWIKRQQDRVACEFKKGALQERIAQYRK